MKKLFAIATITVALMLSGKNEVAAQTKFGYFDLDYVISLMPGVGRVDTLLAQYEQDSIGQEYQYRVTEYQRDDSTLKADSAKMPASLYKDRRNKLFQTAYILQNWQQYSQQAMQAKQQELMQPFTSKAINAYQAVVTEGKYAYVFKREALWQAPPADNLIIPVIKKLGLRVPDELQPQQGGQQQNPGSTPKTTPGTTPKTTPGRRP